jgi:hypothetical protein
MIAGRISHCRIAFKLGAEVCGDLNPRPPTVSRRLSARRGFEAKRLFVQSLSTASNQGWQISDETAMFSKAGIDDLIQSDLPRASFLAYLTALATKNR